MPLRHSFVRRKKHRSIAASHWTQQASYISVDDRTDEMDVDVNPTAHDASRSFGMVTGIDKGIDCIIAPARLFQVIAHNNISLIGWTFGAWGSDWPNIWRKVSL